MNKNSNILITGVNGQLGYEIFNLLKNNGYLHVFGVDIDNLDLTSKKEVDTYLNKYKPDLIIHCAAYTAVDKAEKDIKAVYKINVEATRYLAEYVSKNDKEILYISTDYVFNGEGEAPFEVNDKKDALSIYGKSKAEGEDVIIKLVKKYYIVRTSWLYGVNGNNFIKTILNLINKGTKSLDIVNDQIGSPTYTKDVASFINKLIVSEKYGIYHGVNHGYCSWYDLATYLNELINGKTIIKGVSTKEYLSTHPTSAPRPLNSRLSYASLTNNGFDLLPIWKDAVKRYVNEELFGINKEKIDILLAVYNPDLSQLAKLLDSLKNQLYRNKEILIMDDASISISKIELEQFIKEHLGDINYKFFTSDKNEGTIKTFEKLINLSSGDLIAFADQDDIWHNDKLTILRSHLLSRDLDMVYSDVQVIDNEDKLVATSFTKYKKRFVYYVEDTFNHLLYKNCVIGCTTLARRSFLIISLPLINEIMFDHYLAILSSFNDKLGFVNKSLIDYRVHDNNQTGTLNKVNNKEDYYLYKIKPFSILINHLIFHLGRDIRLLKALDFANARESNYRKEKGSFTKLYKLKKCDKNIANFELFILHNKILFNILIKGLKGNKL